MKEDGGLAERTLFPKPQSNTGAKGYDAPVEAREFDDYERWPLASAISNVIYTSPTEWSTRVGLYGKWGDGKTTVLNFLEAQQRKIGNIVIRYSSWGATTEAAIWRDFGERLRLCLFTAGIQFTQSTTLKHLLKKWSDEFAMFLRGGGKIASSAFSIPVASAVAETTAGIVEKLLGFKKADIQDLIAKVGSRRVIILIDDLDRTDPSIIPRLLLALRELLDLPKFVFVLAFDKQIVCPALEHYHSAWGKSGNAFLDKIVDFPFELSEPEPKHVRALAYRYFGDLRDFFPLETVDKLLEVFPINPRRLKLLTRVIGSLGPEARRHEPGELDWISILIFQMLRLESEDFTRKLVAKILDDKDYSWSSWAMSTKAKPEDEAKFTQFVTDHLHAAEEERQARVLLLVNTWREKRAFQVGERLRYQISFGNRPHHITWGEFKEAFAQWRAMPSTEVWEALVQVQANRLESTTEAAADELVSTILEYYGAILERAAEVRTQEQHSAFIGEAFAALKLCDILVSEGLSGVPAERLHRVDVFGQLLHTARNWVHFRTNPGEQELREKEAALLTQWCIRWPAPLVLFGRIKPWSSDNFGLEERTISLRAELQKCMEDVLWPRVLGAAFELFEKPNGVESLDPIKEHEELYFMLEAPASRFYDEAGIARLVQILSKASDSAVVHENAVQYLELLVDALDHKGRFCRYEDRKVFLGQHADLVAAIWQAAVAKPSQYRFLNSLREYRTKLIDVAEVPEQSLPNPEWLL